MVQTGTPENLQGSVQGSINLYQGTVTILAIFMGFLFTTLVEIYVSDTRDTLIIRVLVAAILLMLMALLSFHNTAHRVIRHYQMALPTSTINTLGGVCLSLGLMTMVVSIALMLWAMGLTGDALVVFVCGGGLMLAMINMRQMHQGATYQVKL